MAIMPARLHHGAHASQSLRLGDAELESPSRRATAPHRMVLRARIVLLVSAGRMNLTN
jgi:hypothetical protein